MKESQTAPVEPPSAVVEAPSFPSRAFGYATKRYWAFLEALVDELWAYEATRGGGDHAPTPLPAA